MIVLYWHHWYRPVTYLTPAILMVLHCKTYRTPGLTLTNLQATESIRSQTLVILWDSHQWDCTQSTNSVMALDENITFLITSTSTIWTMVIIYSYILTRLRFARDLWRFINVLWLIDWFSSTETQNNAGGGVKPWFHVQLLHAIILSPIDCQALACNNFIAGHFMCNCRMQLV